MHATRETLLSFNSAFTLLTVTLLIQVLPIALKAGKGEGVTFTVLKEQAGTKRTHSTRREPCTNSWTITFITPFITP